MSYSMGMGVTAIESAQWKDAIRGSRMVMPRSVGWKDASTWNRIRAVSPTDRPMMGNYSRNPAPSHRYRVYSPDIAIPIPRARYGKYGAIQGLGSVELGLLAIL